MGLVSWLKGNKEEKDTFINLVRKAINKAKKGYNGLDQQLLDVLEGLTLAEIRNELVPFYLQLSPDEKGFVRKWLTEGEIGEKVKVILHEKGQENKVELLRVLLAMKLNPGTELLVEFIADKDDGVRWLAVDVLKELQPRDGIKLLIEKLQQPLKYPPARIGEVLISYGDKALESLILELEINGEKAAKALAVMGFMPIGKVYNYIIKALAKESEDVKLAALEALDEKDEEDYQDITFKVLESINGGLQKLLQEVNPIIRLKAVNILTKLPMDNLELLYQATFDENKLVRINALNGLKIKGYKGEEWLNKIANDDNHPLQKKLY